MCARMRRGYLYNKAKELGCNKIALGHHFDDVIETTLLSMLYGAEIKTMMPKLHSDNFEGLELIRPLVFVKEQDVIYWAKYNDLTFLNCARKFTENAASKEDACSKWESENQEQIDGFNSAKYGGYEGCFARPATEDDIREYNEYIRMWDEPDTYIESFRKKTPLKEARWSYTLKSGSELL